MPYSSSPLSGPSNLNLLPVMSLPPLRNPEQEEHTWHAGPKPKRVRRWSLINRNSLGTSFLILYEIKRKQEQ